MVSVTREKLEPPASLKAPRTLSFLLPMRRSAREKSLSASGFALRAWGYALASYDPTRRPDKSLRGTVVPIRKKSSPLAFFAPLRLVIFMVRIQLIILPREYIRPI